MKNKITFLLGLCLILGIGLFVFNKKQESSNGKMAELRKQHEYFLKNSPFKKTLLLSKKERKAMGLSPNKYYEREWELNMDPATGKPHPERLFKLQETLNANKVPGENGLAWEERGPNNVGGRTRAVMYDPNDSTHKRVFAGGVSGGLWVNNDITSASSAWSLVDMPNNLAISCITYDPNTPTTFYVGTGESYVQGDVNGNGVWKSTDAGVTWTKAFGGVTGETTFESNAKLTVNSPGSIAGEYVITTAAFGPDLTTITDDLILAIDNTGDSDACTAITNNLTGKIAVVRRGDCTFVEKVNFAQTAGAIAVLVVNNVGGSPISLGGDDAGITIPTVMIAKDEGEAIIAQISSGVNVTLEATDSPFQGNFVTPGIQHINDIKIRDNGGTSEVYVAVGETGYFDSSPASILGSQEHGLYRSLNGTSWSKVSLPLTADGAVYVPNDIEISADNTIWVATTGDLLEGDGGGTILSSTNGRDFTVKHTITDGDRTQIAVSSSNPNKIYVLAQINTGVLEEPVPITMFRTENGFTSTTALALPEGTGVPADDFTRGQAFYDLMLEVDPSDDTILYAGGIDLFRGVGSGMIWSQISEWTGSGFSYVHADQHAFVFHPTNSNTAIAGTDGGLFLCENKLSTAATNSNAFVERNKNYITTQFYKAAIGQEEASEKLLAGAQDNGSHLINNASAGVNSSNRVTGGDGAYVFIDKDNEYMISSYVYNVFYYLNYTTGSQQYTIVNNQNTGNFINPAVLDSTEDVLFTNGSSGTTYQINRYSLGNSSASAGTVTDPLLTGAPSAFKVSPFPGDTPFGGSILFVGTDNGKLFKITNANTAFSSWEELTGNEFYGSISCVELGENANEIFVTFHNYGVTNIFYTEDGGTTWLNKENDLPDLPVKAILQNPLNSNEVIIGTELGVWGTKNFNDANPNWHRSQNGMKDVKVTSFDLRTSDNTVVASTYGRGMFTGQFTSDASTLAVDNFTKNNLVKLYPTVSNGEINISKASDVLEGTLVIYDLNGKQVYNTNVNFNNGSTKQLNLNLSSGVYITKFNSEQQQSTQKIIIK
ncbi:Por secretion system C-terminal sorting domain-containing protein [Lutibacter oricola]|uniref:Por secretion system C-terminal sorting domain-containing protein n=1 Tax=Lutibacter oricola TaxID=762486 RepID=A0A1H2R4D5_9FLAO|nr:T9SS type A sorting domain-containing protein [Lutibacter oricola]SDW14306.1 Por secretion system C-terminal sorting domain-containing protein [Lutibacter oricola]